MKFAHLIFAALPLAVAAEPITLKGLAPGMTKEQIEQVHPGFTSSCFRPPANPQTDEICGSRGASRPDLPALVTFAGVRADSYMAMMREGAAHAIMVVVESKDFAQVEAAIGERWGKPAKREVSEVKNRMGASFDQVDVRWQADGHTLSGRKRGPTLDKSSFTLSTVNAAVESAGRRQEAAKAGAKDM